MKQKNKSSSNLNLSQCSIQSLNSSNYMMRQIKTPLDYFNTESAKMIEEVGIEQFTKAPTMK